MDTVKAVAKRWLFATRKPEKILKEEWPNLWPWLVEAYNFLTDDNLRKNADHIVILTSKKSVLFKEALKRFDSEITSKDLEDMEQMSPGSKDEIKRAKKV